MINHLAVLAAFSVVGCSADSADSQHPAFECPDAAINRTYEYRWQAFRRHCVKTPEGWVVTEFLPKVGWAGKYNTIVCPAGHHLREARWMHDGSIAADYARFWFGTNGAHRSKYCTWLGSAILDVVRVTGDKALAVGMLDDVAAMFESWETNPVVCKTFPRGEPFPFGGDGKGLFACTDDREGSELSLGGDGYRPLFNSAMYGEAKAIAEMARLANRSDLAARFSRRASAMERSIREKLWNPDVEFFTAMATNCTRSNVRELHGYAPWYFGMSLPDKASAWRQLLDENGFAAPFGLCFAERRAPGFKISHEGHPCQWNGPSWPFATSIALTGLAHALADDAAGPLRKDSFAALLSQYAAQQVRRAEDGRTIPWVDENLDPFTGEWIARKILKDRGAKGERGEDYNHSTFADLVIAGLCGVHPHLDGTLELRPLIPDSWDYLMLENVKVHGRMVSIYWDRFGSRYGKGAGFSVHVDGREVYRSDAPQKCRILCDDANQPVSMTVGGDGFTNKLSLVDGKWSGHGVAVSIDCAGLVSVVAPTNGLCWVQMDWRHEWPKGAICLGDTWERSYGDLEWRPISADERLSPWYFLVGDGERTDGYGIEVQPNALACWKISEAGHSLRIDVRAGSRPVRLGARRLDAVRIMTRRGVPGETAFQAGRAFCRMMCPQPRLPKEPVYGYNDWYCAYGKNTATNFLADAAYISKCANGLAVRPYVVMDDGWQEHSPPWMKEHTGVWQSGIGPWDGAGRAFGMDMPEFCRRIAALGAKPGLWYRPFAAWDGVPRELRQKDEPDCFDPTLPEVRKMVADDVARFRKWGFKLVKIDYLTYDICHLWTPAEMRDFVVPDGKATWHDDSRTTCEVMKDLYAAMREGAGDGVVIIGCNALNHLAAGLFEVQRIGNDTSGRKWDQTRKYGVNTLGFRVIQDRTFFAADGDCCGLAALGAVPWDKNSQWLELLARSGTPLFVSWHRDLAEDSFVKALAAAFRIASSGPVTGEPLDWVYNRIPSRWRFADGDATYEW